MASIESEMQARLLAQEALGWLYYRLQGYVLPERESWPKWDAFSSSEPD